MEQAAKSYPAPWKLHGAGYIFLYRFNSRFVKQQGRVPDFLKGRFCGGFGSVMLVNYASSDVGPYGELLFIPGKFRFGSKRLDTISKIYVSTMESVVNGRANWGIPKEKAEIRFELIGVREERITVLVGEKTAAEFVLSTGKLSFPVSTKLLPFPLVQQHEGKFYFTKFFGSGKGHLSKIKSARIDADLFPDITVCKPIAVIRVDPFDITFPKAEVADGEV